MDQALLTTHEIAQLVGGALTGNPDLPISGVAGLREARPGDVAFLASPRYAAALPGTRASAVLIPADFQVPAGDSAQGPAYIRVANPSQSFAAVVAKFARPPVQFAPGIHAAAVIDRTARLGQGVAVQAHAVIEAGAVIGDRAVIGAGSYVGHEAVVGADSVLYPRVTLRERVRLGERVVLHSGVVLGADGFGYELVKGRHQKIPQVGDVEIGDDVEIGANSTIDRARFGTTRIGRGTKIDNLVQIGHNCVIGEHCILCGLAGIAGSVIIGNYVTIAGQVGIAGHLTIGDQAIIMAQAGVTKDVHPRAIMLGAPAVPHTLFKRISAATMNLPEYVAKLRELEQQIAELRSRQ